MYFVVLFSEKQAERTKPVKQVAQKRDAGRFEGDPTYKSKRCIRNSAIHIIISILHTQKYTWQPNRLQHNTHSR